MWVLAIYEKLGDAFVEEVELPRLGLDVVRTLWPGNSDEALMGLAAEVDETRARVLQNYSRVPIDVASFDYFVECRPDIKVDRQEDGGV